MTELTGGIRFRISRWSKKVIVEVEYIAREYNNDTCQSDRRIAWRDATLVDMQSLGSTFRMMPQ